MKPGMIPILHSSGVMTPDSWGPPAACPAREHRLHPHHVIDRHTLGYTYDQLDARINGLEDRIRGPAAGT